MRIYAGYGSGITSSGMLTVWLSSGTNYTAGTACVRGLAVIAEKDTYVTCPQTSGVQYGEFAACSRILPLIV